MSIVANREVVGLALAFVGGWGGLASYLAYLRITDVLNRRRAADDQIPQFFVTWADHKRNWELVALHGPFYSLKFAREFRRQFPRDRVYWWYVGGLIWLASFIAMAFAFVVTAAR